MWLGPDDVIEEEKFAHLDGVGVARRILTGVFFFFSNRVCLLSCVCVCVFSAAGFVTNFQEQRRSLVSPFPEFYATPGLTHIDFLGYEDDDCLCDSGEWWSGVCFSAAYHRVHRPLSGKTFMCPVQTL